MKTIWKKVKEMNLDKIIPLDVLAIVVSILCMLCIDAQSSLNPDFIGHV